QKARPWKKLCVSHRRWIVIRTTPAVKHEAMTRLACLVVLVVAYGAFAATPPKLNVLFIISDDLRCEPECFGGRAKTPNIDALAAAGVKFDHAYCQYPLCNPTRSSMLTGRYPINTGVLGNRTYFRDAHPDWITLPQYFKDNGYVTGRAGKIFHGGI